MEISCVVVAVFRRVRAEADSVDFADDIVVGSRAKVRTAASVEVAFLGRALELTAQKNVSSTLSHWTPDMEDACLLVDPVGRLLAGVEEVDIRDAILPGVTREADGVDLPQHGVDSDLLRGGRERCLRRTRRGRSCSAARGSEVDPTESWHALRTDFLVAAVDGVGGECERPAAAIGGHVAIRFKCICSTRIDPIQTIGCIGVTL